ncbi:MAG TPA: DNA polymerase Y family protein [Verrucomicrobiae bacterium]|nr:DNA polymerase Y family protein [Verrucomicrobiae bacterium]
MDVARQPPGLYGVIRVPDFYLQAMLRHEPEMWGRPVAVVDPEEGEGRVMGATSSARAAGVRPGQSPTQALARCDGLHIRARRRDQEGVAREVLLGCAYAHCAFIEDTADGICTMDVTGADAFRRDARGAAHGLLDELAGVALRGQFGLAPTPDLALCAARVATGSCAVLAADDAGDFLSRLPVEALGPDPAMAAIVAGWGIRTAGEFVALGRTALAERLGVAGVRLWDRAAGRSCRPLRLVRPREEFFENSELEFELAELEPLQFRLRRMLEQVVRRLEASHRAVGGLRLELGFSDGACHRANLQPPEPTLNEAALFGLLQNHLERLRAPAGVVAVRLFAEPARAAATQGDIFETGLRDPCRFFETVNRIMGWIGPKRIGYAVLRESHRPDDFVMEPPGSPQVGAVVGDGPPDAAESAAGLTLRRFRPPRPAEVRVQHGRPIFVRAGSIGAGHVRASRGPWTLSGDWWDRGAWEREEWDVEIDGWGLVRIFRESDSWFIDGVYD